MKKALPIVILLSLCISACNSSKKLAKETAPASAPVQLITKKDSVSYAFGTGMAKVIKDQTADYNPAIVGQAINDVLKNKTLMLSEAEIEKVISEEFRPKEDPADFDDSSVEENLEKGRAFLAQNKTKEGVVETESGLQYKVLNEGQGEKPSATSTVTVHYVGTLIDGTEFDNSRKRNAPATFPLDKVITGWSEGVQLMPVGSTYRFFIPAELGYGNINRGSSLPGGSTLIFDVELFEFF